MAKTPKAPAASKPGRLKQIKNAYSMTKQSDPRIGLILVGVFLLTVLLVVLIGWLLGYLVLGVIIGLLLGWVATMFVFAKRAEKAAYGQVAGQTGAAAAALSMLRRGWKVSPAVAFTKNQDLVHRVVGRPGIVLVGEGNPNRVRNLLAVEKRKHARVAADAPIVDVVVGDGSDGSVPVKRLVRHVMKLPRRISPAEVTDLLQRLKALDASRPQAPLPKGPIPQSARAAKQMLRQNR